MRFVARTALVFAWLAALVAAQDRPAPTIEALHFHHVHLNSMNPAAAAAYYPKPFAE
jgi:hypothetical protein